MGGVETTQGHGHAGRWPGGNIAFWLARQAHLAPDRVALQIEDQAWTYGVLGERSQRAAGVLAGHGVGPGDRVAALLPNSVEYVDVFQACAALGAILVPLSTRLTGPELEFMIEDSGARTLIYEASHEDSLKSFRSASGLRSVLAVGRSDDPSFEAECSAAAPLSRLEPVSPGDGVAIFYTSGTTGRPKGAVLTHENFFWTNLNIALALDLMRDERTLVVLPMFHVGGWNVNTLSVWWKGGRVVLERSFDATRVLDLVERERITSLMGVPAIYQALAEHPRFAEADLSSVRMCVCGGAPLPIELIRRYQERGMMFTQGYGLTEAAPNCLLLPPEDAERKVGSAGRPYFFADVRVFDGSDNEVTSGDTGEVVVRGPSVMKGYWRLPEETASALRGGWLRTGDVARVDEDGYLFIVDRVKDMLISGGENVYPAEIENTLCSHEAVAEAAVIGVPDERWGEVGRALVVSRPGHDTSANDLTSFLAERLARFKIPRDFIFVDALPRNATGKLLKQEIRATYGDQA